MTKDLVTLTAGFLKSGIIHDASKLSHTLELDGISKMMTIHLLSLSQFTSRSLELT